MKGDVAGPSSSTCRRFQASGSKRARRLGQCGRRICANCRCSRVVSPAGRALLALFVGLVELSQLLIGRLGLKGGVFEAIGGLNFGSLGFVIVGAFVVTWAAAFAIFKVRRVEERWGEMVAGE